MHFVIPYAREAVFTEVTRLLNPLAADDGIEYSVHPPAARPPATVQLGVMRRSQFADEFNAGYTISECVALEPGRLVRWRQVASSKRGMSLYGSAAHAPEFAVSLADAPAGRDAPAGGTAVTLYYDFASVSGGASAAELKAHLEAVSGGVWSRRMASRGYPEACAGPVARGGRAGSPARAASPPKFATPRSAAAKSAATAQRQRGDPAATSGAQRRRAATRLQALQRGRSSRRLNPNPLRAGAARPVRGVPGGVWAPPSPFPERLMPWEQRRQTQQQRAATRLQALQRGRSSRRSIPQLKAAAPARGRPGPAALPRVSPPPRAAAPTRGRSSPATLPPALIAPTEVSAFLPAEWSPPKAAAAAADTVLPSAAVLTAEQEQTAAVRLQALQRGRRSRKVVGGGASGGGAGRGGAGRGGAGRSCCQVSHLPGAIAGVGGSQLVEERKQAAAVRVQALHRGRLSRKTMPPPPAATAAAAPAPTASPPPPVPVTAAERAALQRTQTQLDVLLKLRAEMQALQAEVEAKRTAAVYSPPSDEAPPRSRPAPAQRGQLRPNDRSSVGLADTGASPPPSSGRAGRAGRTNATAANGRAPSPPPTRPKAGADPKAKTGSKAKAAVPATSAPKKRADPAPARAKAAPKAASKAKAAATATSGAPGFGPVASDEFLQRLGAAEARDSASVRGQGMGPLDA